jgi:uncharacterized membrane-anchored protein
MTKILELKYKGIIARTYYDPTEAYTEFFTKSGINL